MSVFQKADGRWCVRLPKGAHPSGKDYIYCGRGPAGEEEARRLQAEYCRPKGRSYEETFGSIAKDYLSSRGHSMASSTLDATTYCLEAHLIPFFGALGVSELDTTWLDKYVASRKQPQLKRSRKRIDGTYEMRTVYIRNTTIHREISIVKAIVEWARVRGKISRNKIAGYSELKRDDLVQAPPTPDELMLIIAHAAPHLKRAIILAYYTLTRPGEQEALGLRWEHVDFARRTIFIESAKKGGVESRTNPIHDTLFKYLQEWHKQDKALERMPTYIVHYNGQRVARLKTAWNAAKKRAGITRRIKFYSLRHAGVSALLDAGYDPRTVANLAGNTVQVLLRNYYTSSFERKESAVASMPDLSKAPPQETKLVRLK